MDGGERWCYGTISVTLFCESEHVHSAQQRVIDEIVQVKPVSTLNLEKHADEVVSAFLFHLRRNIQEKTSIEGEGRRKSGLAKGSVMSKLTCTGGRVFPLIESAPSSPWIR